jgi:hypothetical protein
MDPSELDGALSFARNTIQEKRDLPRYVGIRRSLPDKVD